MAVALSPEGPTAHLGFAWCAVLERLVGAAEDPKSPNQIDLPACLARPLTATSALEWFVGGLDELRRGSTLTNSGYKPVDISKPVEISACTTRMKLSP